jgi:hypothetical protein
LAYVLLVAWLVYYARSILCIPAFQMVNFFYGVIEGFYGHQWSWAVRHDFASFLAQYGFDCYIYAPKGDAWLRSNWRELYPETPYQRLRQLAQEYQKQGVRWGIGISPLGLSIDYGPKDRQQLLSKIKQLNQLQPNLLCILFDDSRGDVDGLAQRQLQVIADILSVSDAGQFIVCPSYYSFDPRLEQVFGKMPPDYWNELGVNLPASVDIFWTGNQVISSRYCQADLEKVSWLLRRKPVLWDNYPVNDGRITSQYLHLTPYTGRPYELSTWTQGHIVNPMNQPELSRLVLPSLQALYSEKAAYSPEQSMDKGLATINNKALAERIKQDVALFQEAGLAAIDHQQRLQLETIYRAFAHPAADEIADWLAGKYRFDPACLTG